MERKFLKELGLSEETIEKVMAENGKDIAVQQALTKAETEKLNASNEKIEQLKTAAKEYEGVNVKELQEQLNTLQQQHEADMKRQKVDAAVTLALTQAKAVNVKAVKALLEIDPEKAEFDEKGNLKGLDEQLKTLRQAEDSKMLFAAEKRPTFKGFKPAESRDGRSDEGETPTTLADAVGMAMSAQSGGQE
ncbi:MAG: phage scaffolding protein [Candidatus Fimivicinus sp.]|nr:phage scaffolding protein [Oscillospiraceae bacterium]MDY5590100.1 phage scaffolding protein [Candidatus Fimivicinus sp.]